MHRTSALCVLALLVACIETPAEPTDVLLALDARSFSETAATVDVLSATPEELVCGFVEDLDQLSEEAGLAGAFDDDRLNRALAHARRSIVEAREAATIPDLARSFRALRAAMRELEKGAALPVSGKGFADDLASLGSYFGEVFTGNLITLTSQVGSVPGAALDAAVADFEDGVAERSLGEWERAVAAFGKAVGRLDAELDIGPPCG